MFYMSVLSPPQVLLCLKLDVLPPFSIRSLSPPNGFFLRQHPDVCRRAASLSSVGVLSLEEMTSCQHTAKVGKYWKPSFQISLQPRFLPTGTISVLGKLSLQFDSAFKKTMEYDTLENMSV